MKERENKNKNERDIRKAVKLDSEPHKVLKDYCDKHGKKMNWVMSKLIMDNCKDEEGENKYDI